MKIATKSLSGGAPCIAYEGVPGDPGTSGKWCLRGDCYWFYYHAEHTVLVKRADGGGWYVHDTKRTHPLLGIRFPSRRSIVAAIKVST